MTATTTDQEMMEAVDPDMLVLADFLTGEMTADARTAFDKRMKEDQAFFDKCIPILRIWATRSKRLEEAYRWEFQPQWFVRRARVRGWSGGSALGVLISLATAIALAGGGGHAFMLRHRNAAPAQVLGAFGVRRVTTDSVQRRVVELPNGITVHLDPGSRFAYDEAQATEAGGTGTLDGSATIEVPRGAQGFALETPSGRVMLLAGRFRITANDARSVSNVRVDAGSAIVQGRVIGVAGAAQ
jgi:ferric-dicitrate binding protein FerR (iron transport regulator)